MDHGSTQTPDSQQVPHQPAMGTIAATTALSQLCGKAAAPASSSLSARLATGATEHSEPWLTQHPE